MRINLLTHEAQHLADKSLLRCLPPWELEYRAKLAELALAEELRDRLIEKFSADRSNDLDLPHSYANVRVIEAVGDAEHPSEAARVTLVVDSARRHQARRLR